MPDRLSDTRLNRAYANARLHWHGGCNSSWYKPGQPGIARTTRSKGRNMTNPSLEPEYVKDIPSVIRARALMHEMDTFLVRSSLKRSRDSRSAFLKGAFAVTGDKVRDAFIASHYASMYATGRALVCGSTSLEDFTFGFRLDKAVSDKAITAKVGEDAFEHASTVASAVSVRGTAVNAKGKTVAKVHSFKGTQAIAVQTALDKFEESKLIALSSRQEKRMHRRVHARIIRTSLRSIAA